MPTNPPTDLSKLTLNTQTIAAGKDFGRIFWDEFSNPLGYGKTPSRFSDPSRKVATNRFGVVYLGSTFEVCFLEAVLRDLRDGKYGPVPFHLDEFDSRIYSLITVNKPLKMVDLCGNNPVQMGIPTDVGKSSKQSLSRKWSKVFYDHPDQPDGIIYPSRLNEDFNLAVFDRAIDKLAHNTSQVLSEVPELARMLDTFNIAIMD